MAISLSDLKGLLSEALDKPLLAEVLSTLDKHEQLIEALSAYAAICATWNLPLADNVRAEVKIYGKPQPRHVKVLATLVQVIADNYVAQSTPPAPAGESSPVPSPANGGSGSPTGEKG